MTIQPEAPESSETEGRSGLSRRTVIKGAVHAAWAIPAVQVITDVAHAAGPISSNTPADLQVTAPASASWSTTGANATLAINGTVKNVGGTGTSTLQLTFTMTNNNAKAVTLTINSVTGPGTVTWSSSGGNVLTATLQLDPGGTTNYGVTLKGSPANSAGTLTVAATPGGTGKSNSATVTVSSRVV